MLLLTVIITETAPLHQVRSHTHTYMQLFILLSSCPILTAVNNPSLNHIIKLNPTQPPSMIYEAVRAKSL